MQEKILLSDWLRAVQLRVTPYKECNTSANYLLQFWIMICREAMENFLTQ